MKAKPSPPLATPFAHQDGVKNKVSQHPSALCPPMAKTNLEGENRYIMHTVDKSGTMEEAVSISPVLTNALEHIMEQLDILTLVSEFPTPLHWLKCHFSTGPFIQQSLLIFLDENLKMTQKVQEQGVQKEDLCV